jgi:hypothetical protein
VHAGHRPVEPFPVTALGLDHRVGTALRAFAFGSAIWPQRL